MNNYESYNESIQLQMRKGLLELCVLLIIAKGEIYALDILKQLKDANMIVVEGTLYPLLNRLKREGILQYSWQESESGPPRKYYRLTEEGESFLNLSMKHWKGYVASITKLAK